MTHRQTQYLIAVDGGGTGTRAAVGTAEAGILAQASGAPGNISRDFERAIANITQTITAALTQAGLADQPHQDMHAHIGVAGANDPAHLPQIRAAFDFGGISASGDRETTVAGALGHKDGFVVSLGTGTIVARQRAGQIKTVSGWGFMLSDHASGAWLGRQLLERALLAGDGIVPASALCAQMLTHFGGLNGIAEFSLSARPADFAALAPDVVAAAAKGDLIAEALMQEGAAFIIRALTALDFGPADPLCLMGGLGPQYHPYLPEALRTQLCAPKGSALEGAFALARRAAAGGAAR